MEQLKNELGLELRVFQGRLQGDKRLGRSLASYSIILCYNVKLLIERGSWN